MKEHPTDIWDWQHPAGRALVKKRRGQFGTLYSCAFCEFRVSLSVKQYSLAAFGEAVSKVTAHMESEHADLAWKQP